MKVDRHDEKLDEGICDQVAALIEWMKTPSQVQRVAEIAMLRLAALNHRARNKV